MRFPRHVWMVIGCALLWRGLILAAVPQGKLRPVPGAKQSAAPAKQAPPEAPPVNPHLGAIRQNNLGIALMERRQFSEALGKFQTACIMNPQSDIGCLNIGIALLHMNQYDHARTVLAKSAERDPKSPRAWFNLALLEQAEGHHDAAMDDFIKVAALDPNDAETQYFIGVLYADRKEYPKAVAAFQSAIRLDPFLAAAEFGLSQADGQTGDTDGAIAHLNRANHLTLAHLAAPSGTGYGHQGKYSLVQEMPVITEPAPAEIPVHFVDVTAASGLVPMDVSGTRQRLRQNRRRGKPDPLSAPAPAPAAGHLSDFLGSGACVFDFDGDGRPDIFLADADGQGHPALYRNVGHGKFEDVTRASQLTFSGEVLGCATGDYDNDGHTDLAVSMDSGVALFHNEGDGTFTDLTDTSGISSTGLALGLTFIDYDHDGNLDLYATRFKDSPLDDPSQPFMFPADSTGPGNVLWRNGGSGKFVDSTERAGIQSEAPSIGALATDVNNDGAIDLVVSGWQKAPFVYLNNRDGGFQPTSPWAADMPGPAAGAVALDFDHDGWMDLAFTHWSQPGLSLWRNVDGKSFARVTLPSPQWMRGWGIAALDYDNDGWVDLVAVGDTFSGEGRIILLRNEGGDGHGGHKGFRDVTHETGLDKIVLHNPRSVIPFDAGGNGSMDLLITQNHLPPVLLQNVGGNRNSWLQISLTGDPDNKVGLGTEADIWCGAEKQRFDVSGSSGYLGQGPAEIHAGLGAGAEVDVIRLLWPTGILQNEMEIPGGQGISIAETDRRASR
jgi:tetratricopeptide (TPR) repeat protein